MARSPAIVERLADERWPEMSRVRSRMVELREPHLMQARLSRLGGGEVSRLPFGEFIQRGAPLATPQPWPLWCRANNMMSLHTIDSDSRSQPTNFL